MKNSAILCSLIALCALTAQAADVDFNNVSVEHSASQLLVAMTVDASSAKLSSDKETRYLPVITDGEHSVELPVVIVAGRNRYIQNNRHNIPAPDGIMLRNGKSANYRAAVPYSPWMASARVELHADECGCGFSTGSTAISELAQINFATPVFAPRFAFVTPKTEDVKARSESGSAYVDYPLNIIAIYPDYRNNRNELERINATVDKVRTDPDTRITSITITGYASPEGSYATNEKLAEGRAKSLARYVEELYSFDHGTVKAGWVAENWAGLTHSIETGTFADKAAMLRIVGDDTLAPDLREARLAEAFPEEYAWLLKNVYPGLRRSDYKVDYVVRSYTDVNEIKRVMASRPGNLSVQEIFLVANTYPEGSDEYCEAFELAVRLFPDNTDANLNMAVIALKRGEIDRADSYLDKAGDSATATYLRGVTAAKRGDYDKARTMITDAADAGVAEAADALSQLDIIDK